MTISNQVSPEVRKALDFTESLEKAKSKAPSIDDLKHELGDSVQATVAEDGQVSGTISGKDALRRAWEMQADYHMAKAEITQKMTGNVRRVPMVDRAGRVRLVAEEREDLRASKRGYRRLYVAGRRRRLKDGERLECRVPFDFEGDAA